MTVVINGLTFNLLVQKLDYNQTTKYQQDFENDLKKQVLIKIY